MRKVWYGFLIGFAGLAICVLVLSSLLARAGDPTPWEWVQSGSLAAVSGLLAGALTFLFIKLFAEQ